MSRRGRQSAPMSLFSFQDIITSVAGVIIFTTIMLAIELIQRQESSPRAQTTTTVAQLNEATAAAEEEARAIQAQLAENVVELERLAAFSPEAAREQLRSIERQIDSLASETDKAHAHHATLQANQRQLDQDMQASQPDRLRLAELSHRSRELEQRLSELKSENRVLYRPAAGSPKEAWLVEVTDSRFAAAKLGVSGKPVLFEDRSPKRRIATLCQWVKRLDTSQEYLFLVLKPSGIEILHQALPELQHLGYDIGFDLVGAEQTVIDPITGASYQ